MPLHFAPQPFVIHPPADFVRQHPELGHTGFALSQKYLAGEVVTDRELQGIGSALWQALGIDETWAAELKKKKLNVLPILIESETPEVQALPWETLFTPENGFLASNATFTLSRRFSADESTKPDLEKGPLKVLLFTSSPDDLNPVHERLDFEEEQIQIQETFLPEIAQGKVQLEIPDDGRLSTLQEKLASFQPHLLFLSGHGQFTEDPLNHNFYGTFFFEGEDGRKDPVRDEALVQAFVGTGVQCVVLSACKSAHASSFSLAGGLMQKLYEAGIPHVVGMRESILDPAATQFVKSFCQAILGQERIDYAVQTARKAIQAPPESLKLEGKTLEWKQSQWNLPTLLSANPGQPLIDWDFQPHPVQKSNIDFSLQGIPVPARFIGRRKELRQVKKRLLDREIEKLLISGAGGNGKTALAGKLVSDLAATRHWSVFAWSARTDRPFAEFQNGLERELKGENVGIFDRFKVSAADPGVQAQKLLSLLQQQSGEPPVIFLDNLETLQDPKTHEITEATVAGWVRALQAQPGVIFLATSRFQLPGWQGEHLPLTHAGYGDYLQVMQGMIQRGQIRPGFLQKQPYKIFSLLGGNLRGLEFFASACAGIQNPDEEKTFIEALERAQQDTLQDMSIQKIYEHLSEGARRLLSRAWVYPTPVPEEGFFKLSLDLEKEPASLLQELFAVSLIEAQQEEKWQAIQYQIAPLVLEWLDSKELFDNGLQWRSLAAEYQFYLFEYERRTLEQALTTHAALVKAERQEAANQFALQNIVGTLSTKGSFHTLLDDWLPEICRSEDMKIRGTALNQSGVQLLHIGDYEPALSYLKQSLAICQQIGDKAGEGATLNNISRIYDAQGDYDTALSYLQHSLAICQRIGDKAGEGTTLNNISALYHAQGDYDTALSYLQQSLTICQQIGDKAGEGTTLNNISALYHAQGDYEPALTYLQHSLDIRRQIGDKAGEGATLNNISQIYDAQGDYDTALSYLKQSLAICQQIGDKAGLCTTLFNMGHIHLEKKEYTEAMSAWVTAYVIAKSIGEAQILQALADLAPHIGLPAGLEGWEKLAQQMQEKSK